MEVGAHGRAPLRSFTPMRIGVVSDTHGYFDPRLREVLHGVNEILHAGDVGSGEVIEELVAIAPVQAVRGNVDLASSGLPPALLRPLDGFEIYVVHELPRAQSALREWAQTTQLTGKKATQCEQFLRSFPETCRIVIFGHSHEPCLEILGGRLFFNPGSAGKKRFSLPRTCGMLELLPDGARATILTLERYNEDLPGAIWLPRGGP